MEQKLIIYGVGRFAEYAAYLFENDSNYSVHGLCIEKNYLDKISNQENKANLPIHIFEDLKTSIKGEFSIFIAVGNNQIRARIFQKAKDLGYKLASYISSKAFFWGDLIINENVFISEGSVIQPFVEIGANSFIIGSKIGHHSIIGENVLLSGSTIGGNTHIGNMSFLGLNSAVSQNVSIAENNIIGMNATIERDTNENSVYTQKGTTLRKVSSKQISNRPLS